MYNQFLFKNSFFIRNNTIFKVILYRKKFKILKNIIFYNKFILLYEKLNIYQMKLTKSSSSYSKYKE